MAETRNVLKASIDSSGVKKGADEMKRAVRGASGDMQKDLKKSDSVLKGFAKTFGAAFSVTALVAFTRSAVAGYSRQEQALRQLETRIKSTGGAAGFSAPEFERMATSLQKVTTFGDEAIMEMQGLLATFTEVRGDTFKQAQEAILDVSVALGTDLKSAAIQVGKALNDPALGMSALSRSGITFTDQQKDMVKTLLEAGKVTEAQAVILEELNTQMGGSARAAAEGTGKIKQMNNSIGDAVEVLGKFIIEAETTGDLIGWIRDQADVLAGNTSVADWARKSSDPLKIVVFTMKRVQQEIINLGNALGALGAIAGSIAPERPSLKDFLKGGFLGMLVQKGGKETSQEISTIVNAFREDVEKGEQELINLMRQLEGIGAENAPGASPDDVLAGIRGSGSNVPRKLGAGGGDAAKKAAEAAKKAREELASYVEGLKQQERQLTMSEAALARFETAQAVAGMGSSALAKEATTLTEKLILLNEQKEKEEENLKRVTEMHARATAMVAATITPQEQYNETIKEADKLLKNVALSHTEYLRVIDKAEKDLKTALDSTKDDTLDILDEIESATKKFGDQFVESMINVTKGVSGSWKDMANSIVDDINRIILRTTIVDPLVKSLKGALEMDGGKGSKSGSGGIGGIFGMLGGLFGGGTPDFSGASAVDMGGYITDFPTFGLSTGSRNVPYDQLSFLHKGERVHTAEEARKMDQAQEKPITKPNISVVNNFSISAPSGSLPRETQAQVAARVGAQVNRVLSRDR